MISKLRNLQIVIPLFFFVENRKYPLAPCLSLVCSLHHIYILSPLPLNSLVSQGLALFFVFALRRSSSQFQVTILHYPSLNL